MSPNRRFEKKNGSSDLECAEEIRLGNTSAFSVLFRKYYEPLYRFAGRFVKDPQIAENMVQDVFVKIWSNRQTWRVESNVKSYLYTAVRNHALNYLKRDKRMSNIEDGIQYTDVENRSPDEALMEKELLAAVHKAVDKLPDRCRQIYLMHRYDELKYTEIAEILDISINTVKTQMKRAIRSLSKNLKYLLLTLLGLILK